jgi:hypothetical protein
VYWDEGDQLYDEFVYSTGYQVTPDQLQYTVDQGLEATRFYRFKVSAVNEIGESPLSESSVPWIAAEVPTKPLLLREVEATKLHIKVTWDAPLLDNGSDIVNYNVYVDGIYKATTTHDVLEWQYEAGVVTGTEYEFSVSALNMRGESVKSDAVSIYAAVLPT